jgi:colanic acid biosynthesis glycosyl transferase WcaI
VHVLVIGINYWPEQTGIGVFTTGRCEYLASRGHQVTVCTSFPYYPDWRTMEGYRGQLYLTEQRKGVDICRTWMYVPNQVTSIRRVLHEGSFISASLPAAMSRARPDIILAVSPPLGLAATAIILGRRWRVPYVFHVADLQPDAAVDLGMIRSRIVVETLYRLERMAYRNAALVSTLTGAMRERIVHKNIPTEKVTLVPDWSQPELFDLPLSGGGLRFKQQYSIGDRFIVSHSGNMGVKQGLEVMLGAAEAARDSHPELLFLLVGDGAMKPKLQERARLQGLDNVLFLPILPAGLFNEMLAASDLCLVTQQKAVADIVFPSKVLTLLSAGRPVVASLSEGSEVAHVLREAQAGVRTEAEDPTALLDAIVKLQALPERRAAMGANGRAYARQHWEKDRTLRAFESRLLEVVYGDRGATQAAPTINLEWNEQAGPGVGND